MKDNDIIELFWKRSENAITETSIKYGKYCFKIAQNILDNEKDSEECVNDAYLKVWNHIPPQRPNNFAAYLGRTTRNTALDKYKNTNRKKRGQGQTEEVLEELTGCIPSNNNTEYIADNIVLAEVLNKFLSTLPTNTRKVFMQRYWYMSSVKEISKELGYSESKVKMLLLRTRNELKLLLEKEGINL